MNDDETRESEQIDPYLRRLEEQTRRQAQADAQRRRLLQDLLGSDDPYERLAPPPVEDLDAQLGEHAAQLRNAIRYTLGYVLDDEMSFAGRIKAVGAVDRMIRTNLNVIKQMQSAAQKSKTVHGGEPPAEPQH